MTWTITISGHGTHRDDDERAAYERDLALRAKEFTKHLLPTRGLVSSTFEGDHVHEDLLAEQSGSSGPTDDIHESKPEQRAERRVARGLGDGELDKRTAGEAAEDEAQRQREAEAERNRGRTKEEREAKGEQAKATPIRQGAQTVTSPATTPAGRPPART